MNISPESKYGDFSSSTTIVAIMHPTEQAGAEAVQYGSGGTMVGCGVLYSVMGIMCQQLHYNRMRQNYRDRRQRADAIRDSPAVRGAVLAAGYTGSDISSPV